MGPGPPLMAAMAVTGRHMAPIRAGMVATGADTATGVARCAVGCGWAAVCTMGTSVAAAGNYAEVPEGSWVGWSVAFGTVAVICRGPVIWAVRSVVML